MHHSTSDSRPANIAMQRTNIFVQVLKDYMIQTTLHGYRYLAEPGRHWFERVMWVLVHVASTSCLLIIVYGMYVDYFNQKPVTTVKSQHHPIREVPFPGIAVCDINKLRKSRTLELASQLYNEYNVSVSEKRLGELLRNLGLLYDQSEQDNAVAIIKELDEVLTAANITLNITEVMTQLSTKCEELLVRCRWESRTYPCLELFKPKRTMEGFCCTFNYIRPTDNFQPELLKHGKDPPRTSPTAGPHMGLTVLVKTNLSDYFYPSLPAVGLKVLIFNPYDYPDTGSGGLTELLVTMQQEIFFSLSSITTRATQLVQDVDIDRRKCIFNNELEETFGELYSYSDCMMACRTNSIQNMCGCLPFFAPSEESVRICGIEDISCLLKYRDAWQTMKPNQDDDDKAKFDGLQEIACAFPCLPSCTSTLYTVQASSMPLSQSLIRRSGLYPTVDIKNHSIVHIYFGSPSTPLMETDVLTTWFELLSNIGGVCGVFVGFSLMSIVEFVYFFTVRLAFEAFDKHRQKRPLHPPELQRKDSGFLEIETDSKKPRAQYGWNIYPKKRIFPAEDKDTGLTINDRRISGRSPQVNIFWNEISRPGNSKTKIHDLVY